MSRPGTANPSRGFTTTAGLLVGVALGGLLVAGIAAASRKTDSPSSSADTAAYTCSMHPQIVMDHADLCPLCGMDLTPVRTSGDDGWENGNPGARLALSETARRMADVGSVAVGRRELFQKIRTVGRVEVDETRVASVAARINGPVVQVFAAAPGLSVRRGEELASIRSSEVLNAEHQFLWAQIQAQPAQPRIPQQPPLEGRTTAASSPYNNPYLNPLTLPRLRLQVFGMNDAQIDELAKRNIPQDTLTLCAPIGGTIIEKRVRAGQYVKDGDVLYTIADLSQVWMVAEVFESELAWVRIGQPVQITLEGEPDRPAAGSVGFIEPLVNDATRTVRIRVFLENRDGRFRPGMYAVTVLRVPVPADGSPAATDSNDKTVLAVPAEAVLTTGRRHVAYREVEPGKYEVAELKLGPRVGEYYPVVSGLKDGDRVVTRGGFLLDSQYQITGKTCLLYARSERAEKAAHSCCQTAAAANGLSAAELANLEKLPEEDRATAIAQRICPVTGKNLGGMGKPYRMEIHGRTLFLCCKGCEGAVRAAPDAAFAKIEAAHPKPAVEKPAACCTQE